MGNFQDKKKISLLVSTGNPQSNQIENILWKIANTGRANHHSTSSVHDGCGAHVTLLHPPEGRPHCLFKAVLQGALTADWAWKKHLSSS